MLFHTHATKIPPGPDVSDILSTSLHGHILYLYTTFETFVSWRCHLWKQPTGSSAPRKNIFAPEYDSSITIYYKKVSFFPLSAAML